MISKKIAAIIFLGAVSCTWAAEFSAGPPRGNWAKVQSLSKGENLHVTLKQGDMILGEFIRPEEQSIILSVAGRERVYPKAAVSDVRWLHGGSRMKNAAIAGGIFFPIGFLVGYALAPRIADVNEMKTGERMGASAAVGALWGGIAAGIAGAVKPGVRETVIYRAN